MGKIPIIPVPAKADLRTFSRVRTRYQSVMVSREAPKGLVLETFASRRVTQKAVLGNMSELMSETSAKRLTELG